MTLHNVQGKAFFEQKLTVLRFRIGYLFCGEACVVDKKHPDWTKGLQKASTFSFKDSTLAKCHKRPEKCVDVKGRLSNSTGSCRDSTGRKASKYGFISDPYFPVFGLNTAVFSPNRGKYGSEINRYLDTFHAVRPLLLRKSARIYLQIMVI